MAFAQVSADHARGVEAARVVDDDRRLPNGADEIECHRQRRVTGFLADDELDQHHALDRRKEVDADELRGILGAFRQRRDRQR